MARRQEAEQQDAHLARWQWTSEPRALEWVWLVRVSEREVNPTSLTCGFVQEAQKGVSDGPGQRIVDVSEGGLAH
jgi:hypothetical protein